MTRHRRINMPVPLGNNLGLDKSHHELAPRAFPPRVLPALEELLRARDYAKDSSVDLWEFAVAMEALLQTNSTATDLRWLVARRLADHATEVTAPDNSHRVFRPATNLQFSQRSCFVLTNYGTSLLHGTRRREGSDAFFPGDVASGSAASDVIPIHDQPTGTSILRPLGEEDECMKPTWDSEVRTLVFDGALIKQFRWRARNQETVLTAFEEEGWPPRIDDPLPPQAEQDAKRRLADTIKCLNQRHVEPVIRFRGDGTGEGVRWELVAP